MRLTDCHSGGTVCSPSRASILTGRTPYRTGFYTIAGPEGSHLRKEEITLATLLKKQGYDTCFVGKWHLGNFQTQPNPGDHGFDHWFGTAVNAFDGPEDTDRWVRNGEKVGKVGQWYCDAIVAEAITWMNNRPDPDKPYFIFVCAHEPHTPVRPPEKFSQLYQNIETDIQESALSYGQVHRPLERDIAPNKKYYYGTVTQLDAAFGRLVDSIDKAGHRDDSLVIFTSDNGPETPVTVEESGNQWEDPIRDRCFGTPGPWRGMKRFVFEGGHRVPGIVRWPGKVDPDTLSPALINGTDWFTTACQAAGIALPDDRTIDGVDILPALQGKEVTREIPACWMFPVGYDSRLIASMSMRQGKHVMVGWFEPKNMDKATPRGSAPPPSSNSSSTTSPSTAPNPTSSAKPAPKLFTKLQTQMKTLWKDIQSDAPDWPSLK